MVNNERWRHKKSGTIYEIITNAAGVQCSLAPQFEDMFEFETWTVYRNVETFAIFVRPTKEFMDGRFERCEATAIASGKPY